MNWRYNDGGREAAGFKGKTDDCVTRAIAIATEMSYEAVYVGLNETAKRERNSSHKRGRSHARTGVHKVTERRYMEELGWEWVPTMFVGQGCQVHLKADELPSGRLVVVVSKHSTAVIDGVIEDVFDPSREGTRCVYGYYRKP